MSEQTTDTLAPASRSAAHAWMDAARALAAVAVVMGHARDLLIVDYPGDWRLAPFYLATGLGHQAVIVFFVLSGYWIGRSVERRAASPHFWRGYLTDRLSRLYLVFIPALVLGGALDALGLALHLPIYNGQTGAHSLSAAVAPALDLGVALGNLVFLQSLAVPALGSNGPLWSLAYEFWFYLWFPALFLSAIRRRPSPILLVLALGLAFPLLAWGFLSWLVGFAVRVLERRSSQPSPTVVRSARGHAIGLLALGSMLTLGRWSQSLLFDPLIAIAFGAVLVGLLKDRALAPPPRWLAAYGARASYSLYAIHFPLLVLAAGWVTRSAGRLAPGPLGLALVAAFVLSAIAAGWLFSRATEAHTPRIRSWLADRRPIQGELARVTADRRD